MTDYEGRYLHQQFGNYRLIKLLGYGGFAEVYLGAHVHMGTLAAVKVLTARLTPDETAHFRNEALTIFGLEHPNIVRVLDYGLNGNIPYIVMSYAPNGSLRTRHPRGTRVPLPIVVEYVKQIATALQYAHDHNIIHRDIKPDNILVGSRGELLISDFGIAVISKTGRTSLQSFYDIGGTPYYMAPEAFRGKPEKASDQYSLGIMVYEWLCGQPPFTEGDSIQIGYQHNYELVPSLCEQASSISSAVEQVVMRVLAKSPRERFGNVREFVEALEEVSKKPPIGRTLLKFEARGYSSLGGYIWNTFAWSPNGKWIAISDGREMVKIWDATTWSAINSSGEHGNILRCVVWSPDSTQVAIAYDKMIQLRAAISGQLNHSFRRKEVYFLSWSPDGNKIASDSSNALEVWDAHTGQTSFSCPGYLFSVDGEIWSPDGCKLISVDNLDEEIGVWDAATGQLLFTYTQEPPDDPAIFLEYLSHIEILKWSHSGHRIISVHDNNTVKVWDATNGQNLFSYEKHSSRVHAVAWSPDESKIASADDQMVQVWNVQTGQQLLSYQGHKAPILDVAWSPDGQRLASCSDDHTVQVWEASRGKHVFTYQLHTSGVEKVAWSPNGHYLASQSVSYSDDWVSGIGKVGTNWTSAVHVWQAA